MQARVFELRPQPHDASSQSRVASAIDDVFHEVIRHGSKHNSISIVFVDEIEGFTLDSVSNQRLVYWLDVLGSRTDTRRVLIGATNRPQDVNMSMRRGGRLEVEIRVGKTTASHRLQLLTTAFEGSSWCAPA